MGALPILAAGLFLAPGLAAAGAAAIAVPIAIHLLTRMKRKQVEWAAMKFLIEAYRRQRRRLQLEQLLLLLIRCLILLALGFALAGPAAIGLARKLGTPVGGRVVYLVIDDALSLQAHGNGQNARFEDLRALALKVIDGLSPGDQAALFTAARPASALISNPTADLARVRRIIESLQPRDSRADWAATMDAAASSLALQKAGRERAALFVLSDFSAGSLDPTRPLQASVKDAGSNLTLGQAAKVIVTRPMPSVANVQIESLTPRRTMVLAPANGPAVVPLELSLRRFGSDTAAGLSGIEIVVTGEGDASPANTTLRREVRWAQGQGRVSTSLEVTLPPEASRAGEGSGTALTIRARVDRAGMNDALPADDVRVAVVELRSRLAVAMIDESAAPTVSGGDLTPREWASLALQAGAPRGTPGPIQVLDRAGGAVDDAALKGADAAMVFRPDLLPRDGWTALSRFASRGGLVWVFTPPLETSAVWTTALKEQLAFPGAIGIEPRAMKGDADATGEATGWRLTTDTPTPEPLKLLSADWATLLRSVRVYRRLDITLPASAAEGHWLTLAEPGADLPRGLLTTWPLGDGRGVLLATALDPAWSNLPTKPLFVPLLHETLRSVLGTLPRDATLSSLVSGDAATLSARWEGSLRLVHVGDKPAGPEIAVAIRRTDAGLETAAPMMTPGVYVPEPRTPGLRLAANVDSAAGDTTALDEAAVSAWIGTAAAQGEWSWINADAPTAALSADEVVGNLGWPLLWVTLSLLVAETFLARRFSHAELPAVANPVSAAPWWRSLLTRGGAR